MIISDERVATFSVLTAIHWPQINSLTSVQFPKYGSAWLLKYFLQCKWMLRDRTDTNVQSGIEFCWVRECRWASGKADSRKVIGASHPCSGSSGVRYCQISSEGGSVQLTLTQIFQNLIFLWVPRLSPFLLCYTLPQRNYIKLSQWRTRDFPLNPQFPGQHCIHSRQAEVCQRGLLSEFSPNLTTALVIKGKGLLQGPRMSPIHVLS